MGGPKRRKAIQVRDDAAARRIPRPHDVSRSEDGFTAEEVPEKVRTGDRMVSTDRDKGGGARRGAPG